MTFREMLAKAEYDYGLGSYEARRFVHEQLANQNDRIAAIEAKLGLTAPSPSSAEVPHLYPITTLEVSTTAPAPEKKPVEPT